MGWFTIMLMTIRIICSCYILERIRQYWWLSEIFMFFKISIKVVYTLKPMDVGVVLTGNNIVLDSDTRFYFCEHL